jgi:hypothetical protein
MKDVYKTDEDLLKSLREMKYTEQFIQKQGIKKLWNMYYCDTCPMANSNICKQCSEGSFACVMFFGGCCSYSGKVPAKILEYLGMSPGALYEDIKTITQLDGVLNILEEGLQKTTDENILRELKLAKHWLKAWKPYIECEKVYIYAFY